MNRLIVFFYHPAAKAAVFVLVMLATVGLLSLFIPLVYLNALANLWALWNVIRVLWYYHWTSDWASTEIGRGTVAIKASMLLIIVVGLFRRVAEQVALHSGTELQRLAGTDTTVSAVDTVGSFLVTVTWVVMAVVLGNRLRAIRELQRDSGYKPSMPWVFRARTVEHRPEDEKEGLRE